MPIPWWKTFLLAALLATAGGGCAARNHFSARAVLPDDGSHSAAMQRAQQALAGLFPPRYRSTQRAIITVAGKQFTCDGLLTVSPTQGHHLALVSSLGTVTNLRVKPDGEVELLKVTPLFREDWSRRFVARDVRRLFMPPMQLQPAGCLADGRLVLQTAPDAAGATAEYIFAADGSRWLELDVRANGKTVWRAIMKNYQTFPGTTTEVPGAFDVSAERYRLQLRLATLEPERRP